MTQGTHSTQARLDAVERELKMWRRCAVALLLVPLVVLVQGQSTPDKALEAGRFVLTDRGGKRVAELCIAENAPSLRFYDKAGKPVVLLNGGSDGDPSLLLLSEKVQPRTRRAAPDQSGISSVRSVCRSIPTTYACAILSAGGESPAALILADRGAATVAAVSIPEPRSSQIVLSGPDLESGARVGVDSSGAVEMGFFRPHAQASFGVTTDAVPFASLRGAEGKSELSVKSGGLPCLNLTGKKQSALGLSVSKGGSPYLNMHDVEGRLRAILNLMESGEPRLRFCDGSGGFRTLVGYNDQRELMLGICGDDGKSVAELKIAADAEPRLRILDKRGRLRAMLGVQGTAGSLLALSDRSDVFRATLSAEDDGTSGLRLLDTDEKPKGAMLVGVDGDATLVLGSRAGKLWKAP